MNDIRVIQLLIVLVAVAGWFSSRAYDFSFAWIAWPCGIASAVFLFIWAIVSNIIL